VWRASCTALEACIDCRRDGLIHEHARPLFGKFQPRLHGVLFVFEAPNQGDTTDPKKGYITYDVITDPTGKFTHELFSQVLGLVADDFQVTNSVLCLPARRKNSFTVQAAQTKACSEKLRQQIVILDPRVVVSVGGQALAALRLLEDHHMTSMSKAVAQPTEWFGRWLFPLAHTSVLGRMNRAREKQVEDWMALKKFLAAKDVRLKG
jgi:uracil-DNA glycosylase family 4